MNTPENVTESLITEAEIDALNAARDVLKAIGKRTAHDRASAMLDSAAENADWFIFQMLNRLDSYGGVTMTYRQLHNADPLPEPELLS